MGVTAAAGVVEVERVEELREELARRRAGGAARIGFVPTMGALHAGHAELMRTARRECDVVVTSCYANPTQFGAGEDFDRYPSTPGRDLEVARDAGSDVLWRPRTEHVYGADVESAVRVVVGEIGTVFEGRSRPGHFDGVATVVVRLLAAVGPDVLYLGRKDYQQLVVLRRVVRDLLLPVEVRAVDTVRDHDGLALSSRNAYLSPDERAAALAIPRALELAARLAAAGETDASRVLACAREHLAAATGIELDYAALADADGLGDVDEVGGEHEAVLLVAARVGTTRLIDNRLLPAGAETTSTAPSTDREARP